MKTKVYPNTLHCGQPSCHAPVVRGTNSLTVKAAGTGHTIDLIGTIGKSYWDESGITEKEFRDALNSVPVGSAVKVNVNSEGGSVKEGLGIYNAIKERRAEVTVYVTGYAMSIASVFPLAAGKVVSPRSAIWMMHKASTWASGNADDMRQAAEMLDQHDEVLADIYVAETGKTKAEIKSAMEAVTWIKGADAVAFGLADESDLEEPEAKATYRPLAQAFLARCNVPPEILSRIQNGIPAEPNNSAEQNGGQPKTTNEREKNSMNKKVIVALLVKHGIQATETETEEQLQAKLDTIPTAKADNVTDIADLRAEIVAQKRARITDKVKSYAGVTNAEVPIFVDAAMKDEAGTFVALDARPAPVADSEPVGANRIEGGDAPVLNGYQGRPTEMVANVYKTHTTPEARYNAFKQEYSRLCADAAKRGRVTGDVMNVNTFAAAITTNFLIQGAITQLGPQVAPLKAFSRDNSVDPYKPLAVGIQKFNTTVQDGSDTLTSPTDWATVPGDSTLTGPSITPLHYSQLLYLTSAQLNSGIRMADLIEAKLGSFRSKIASVAMAPITKANFGTTAGTTGAAAPLVSAAAAFGFSDLAQLQGSLKKSVIKNVLLDGEYIARISNSPTFFQQAGLVGGMRNAWSAFGWDLLALNTVWPSGENVVGFACNPQAIGIIAGLPLNAPEGIVGNVLQTGVAQLAGPDIAVATYLWYDVNVRTLRASYDIVLGSSAIDKTAGTLVCSA